MGYIIVGVIALAAGACWLGATLQWYATDEALLERTGRTREEWEAIERALDPTRQP